MKRKIWPLCAAGFAVALAGCNRSEKTEAKSGDAAPTVIFAAGRGLKLPPETIRSLGVTTAEAKEQTLSSESTLMVQVYAEGSPARALALVPATNGEMLSQQKPAGARLLSVQRAIEPGTHQVELLFELPQSHHLGDFVPLTLHAAPTPSLAVPRAAVIDGANGSFVYVVNGGYYLRTAVKTGARDADWIEITDGLYAGDVVVITATSKLWLTELRLTKGGGDID